MNDDITVEIGGGNVFADLGLPNAEEHLAKAELASRINAAIRQRRLTQAAAAELLGVDQPKISRLQRGVLANFSVERLLRFLTLLGRDVDIVVRPRARGVGQLRVVENA